MEEEFDEDELREEVRRQAERMFDALPDIPVCHYCGDVINSGENWAIGAKPRDKTKLIYFHVICAPE